MSHTLELTTRIADYENDSDRQAVVKLLNEYAMDPMGGGTSLKEEVKATLCDRLAARDDAFSILCFDGDTAIGLANCFEGFSTFKAMPLINIHDIAVSPGHRGKGVGQVLLAAIEKEALRRGSCKITLEVLSNNYPAKKAYQKFGFSSYELDPEAGQALFWEKSLL